MRKNIYIVGVIIVAGFAYYLGLSKNNNNSEQEQVSLISEKIPSDQNDPEPAAPRGVGSIANKISNSHPSKKISPDADNPIFESEDEKVTAESENARAEGDAEAVGNNPPVTGRDGPITVDPKSPLSYKYTFDQEKRLESWAAPSEKSLTESVQHSQFGERYKLESIECKTTLCITKVSIPVDKTNPEMEKEFGWYEIVHSMRQSELDQNLSEYETAVYVDTSAPPRIIYESTFIKKNQAKN